MTCSACGFIAEPGYFIPMRRKMQGGRKTYLRIYHIMLDEPPPEAWRCRGCSSIVEDNGNVIFWWGMFGRHNALTVDTGEVVCG